MKLALPTISAATGTILHAYDGMLGLLGRTASQIALLRRVGFSAEPTPVLGTDL